MSSSMGNRTFYNFGSLNMDYVYGVEHIVRPGETIDTLRPRLGAGGKGLNQSVALAGAGVRTVHLGKIGTDGLFLRELLRDAGADVSGIVVDEKSATGHAVIQVDGHSGQNAILLFGGANREITREMIGSSLERARPGDVLLVQNELNAVGEILRAGHERGMYTAFNCAPFTPEARAYPYELVDLLFVNETEGGGLTGETEPEAMLRALGRLCPGLIVLTLGIRGALALHEGRVLHEGIVPVQAVDTTGAGDTYTGYFLAELMTSGSVEQAMRIAAAAAALEVTRPGAAAAVPKADEVQDFLRQPAPEKRGTPRVP